MQFRPISAKLKAGIYKRDLFLLFTCPSLRRIIHALSYVLKWYMLYPNSSYRITSEVAIRLLNRSVILLLQVIFCDLIVIIRNVCLLFQSVYCSYGVLLI